MTTNLGALPDYNKTKDAKLAEKAKPKVMHYDKNPEEHANIFNYLFFSFVTPLVTHGFRTSLTPEDLWPIAQQDRCEVSGAKLDKIWQAERTKKGAKASLFNCTFRYFGISMIWIGLLTAVARAGELAQPTILGEFILWYVNPFAPMWHGYAWAATFFAIPFISAIVTAQSMQIATRGMAQLRGSLASMVYDKSIRISSTSNVALPERQSKKSKKAEKKEKGNKGDKGDKKEETEGKPKPQQETTTGKVVNLMSADAEKVGMMMMMAPNSLITPIQVAVNLALIYQTMESATFAGLAALFLAAPFMGMALRWMTIYSQKQNLLTDTRLKIINELMQGMRMVKFYAWETSFYEKVNIVRKAELREIFRVTFSFQFFNLVLMLVPVVIPLATFSVYLYAYGNVSVFKIFKTLAYFQTLQMPLVMIPMSLSQLGVGAVSCKRIQTFLELPELDPALVKPTPADATHSLIVQGTFAYEPVRPPPGVQKKRGSTVEETVIEISKPFQLTEIDFRAETGKLTAVIGSVGSGKSTLVAALLGEMRPVPGTQALVQCTEHVGYAAQKAWIQSLTIRDNILFGREYNEARYNATVHACALTADFASLPHGDSTEIGDRGINLSGGQKQRIALARCVYSGATSFIFDDPLSAVDANVGEHIMKQCFVQALEGTTRVLVMNQLHFLPSCDFVYVLEKGTVVAKGTFAELNAGNPYFQKLVQEHAAALSSDSQEQKVMQPAAMERAPSEEKNAAKKLTDEDIAGLRNPARLLTLEEQLDDRLPNDQTKAEEIGTGRVAGSGYVTHAKFMSWPLFFGYLLTSCAAQAGLTIGNGFVMSWWSSNKFQRDNWFYIELLGLVGLGTGAMVLARGLFFSFATKQANGRYHDALFKATLRAPCSFYDVTPTGRILNRFSKDMNDIDGVLPRVWQGAFNISLSILGSLISTAIMTPLFLIIMAIVGILFVALQRFFSRSTIQLKRIEAVSRSPVYSHFGETLAGLATIRAFKHAERFRFTKVLRVDRMTNSFFSLRCVLNWASLRVGTLNAIMLAFAALFVVLAKGVLDPGSASLAVYFVLGIGPMLGFLVSSITELDNNMNAVERVHQYSLGMEQEASWEKSEVAVPENWPAEGKISLKDVVFRYRKNLDPVLHGISAEINSKEKIGVAGRTGSGKSSLMLCLFRMYEIDSGSIHIDGIDIQKLGLHVLRKKLAIIPQDPFVFSGTIRENLDPFHVATDEEVWDSLRKVQLEDPTKAMGGLLAPVKEYGENLSAGQRQLLCIARAVLRKPKILVMDEATSSVDSSTDTMIQHMVREAFKESTTVTIAHRLNTIMDSDRVMVLKSGNLAEFGEPGALVASGGVFAAMHHAMTHGH